MIADCTRCGNERKVMPIYMARPGGHSFLPPPDFEAILPPEIQRSCGDCLTDREIARELGPVVEFVVGTLIQDTLNEKDSSDRNDWLRSLELVRAIFMVRNNNPVEYSRHAAVRALGLGLDGDR